MAAWAAVGEAPLEYLRTMLSHGGAASAELSCNLGPVAGRAQLIHEGLQLLLLVLCPAAMLYSHGKYIHSQVWRFFSPRSSS